MREYGFSKDRLTKREHLITHGINPYSDVIKRTHLIDHIISNAHQLADKEVTLVGRIIEINNPFTKITIEDSSGQLDIVLSSQEINHFQIYLDNLERGDFISAKGIVCKEQNTKAITVRLLDLTILTKSLIDLPDQLAWEADKESQRKQRYIDLAIRKDARTVFKTRVELIRNIRRYLDNLDMYEVETPILRSWYDIVSFDQYTTSDMNGRPLYLRLCHEDRLKQLLSGGFENVYELGRSFRRDNSSWKHNPEFLQLETIQAYTDYEDMMRHAEDMYYVVTKQTLGKTIIRGRNGDNIDLTPPWTRISVRDAILKYAKIDIYAVSSPEALRFEIEKRVNSRKAKFSPETNVAYPPADDPSGVSELPQEPYSNWFWGLVEYCVGAFVEPHLIQPTILYDYPLDSNWLVKRKQSNPEYIERFEAYIDGIEIANCYTLVNDPVDFVNRLEDQLGWYCSAFGQGDRPLDESLILAKGYGLPPMSESSFGIDRWLMIICEQESIKDVIWMPYPYI